MGRSSSSRRRRRACTFWCTEAAASSSTHPRLDPAPRGPDAAGREPRTPREDRHGGFGRTLRGALDRAALRRKGPTLPPRSLSAAGAHRRREDPCPTLVPTHPRCSPRRAVPPARAGVRVSAFVAAAFACTCGLGAPLDAARRMSPAGAVGEGAGSTRSALASALRRALQARLVGTTAGHSPAAHGPASRRPSSGATTENRDGGRTLWPPAHSAGIPRELEQARQRTGVSFIAVPSARALDSSGPNAPRPPLQTGGGDRPGQRAGHLCPPGDLPAACAELRSPRWRSPGPCRFPRRPVSRGARASSGPLVVPYRGLAACRSAGHGPRRARPRLPMRRQRPAKHRTRTREIRRCPAPGHSHPSTRPSLSVSGQCTSRTIAGSPQARCSSTTSASNAPPFPAFFSACTADHVPM